MESAYGKRSRDGGQQQGRASIIGSKGEKRWGWINDRAFEGCLRFRILCLICAEIVAVRVTIQV